MRKTKVEEGRRNRMGRKGQKKKLVADVLDPEETKIKLRKNTDVPTESVTSVGVSQDWKI